MLYRVHGEAETLKGVSAQERRSVVFGKDNQSCHALAVYCGPGLTVVHLDTAPIREEESALADRFDSDVAEQR